MSGRRRAAVAVLIATGAIAGLCACSQVAAIAPVGGDHLAEVRYATIDVLLHHDIDFLAAPVCSAADDGAVSCAGETTDGMAISAESTAADPTNFTLTVGTEQLYDGSIMTVIDDAARETS